MAYCVFTHSVVSDFPQPHGLYPTRLFCLWNSPGKNIAESCHFQLQRVFSTQGLNFHLLHLLDWWADSLLLAPPGTPCGILLGHKRNKIESFVVMWIDLESVMYSEVSQKEKIKYSLSRRIYGI